MHKNVSWIGRWIERYVGRQIDRQMGDKENKVNVNSKI